MNKHTKITVITLLLAAAGHAVADQTATDPVTTSPRKALDPFPYTGFAPFGYPAGYGLGTTVMPVPRTAGDPSTVVNDVHKGVASK